MLPQRERRLNQSLLTLPGHCSGDRDDHLPHHHWPLSPLGLPNGASDILTACGARVFQILPPASQRNKILLLCWQFSPLLIMWGTFRTVFSGAFVSSRIGKPRRLLALSSKGALQPQCQGSFHCPDARGGQRPSPHSLLEFCCTCPLVGSSPHRSRSAAAGGPGQLSPLKSRACKVHSHSHSCLIRPSLYVADKNPLPSALFFFFWKI